MAAGAGVRLSTAGSHLLRGNFSPLLSVPFRACPFGARGERRPVRGAFRQHSPRSRNVPRTARGRVPPGPLLLGGPGGALSGARQTVPTAAAARAAPTIPAVLRRVAGTMGVRMSSRGRNLSALRLTPPPTTIRSGQTRSSTTR